MERYIALHIRLSDIHLWGTASKILFRLKWNTMPSKVRTVKINLAGLSFSQYFRIPKNASLFAIHPSLVQAPSQTHTHLWECIHSPVPGRTGGQYSISHSRGTELCESHHWPQGYSDSKSYSIWEVSRRPPVCLTLWRLAPLTCLSLSSLLKLHMLSVCPLRHLSDLFPGFREAAASEGCYPSPNRVHSHGKC